MRSWHDTIKYIAIALAVIIIISIISGIMYVLSFMIPIFTPDVKGENMTYEIENIISVLDIDINSIDLEVKSTTDSNFRVESNYKYLTVTENDNKLLIKDKKSFFHNIYNEAELTLYIPEDQILEKAEINTGAGATNLENIRTNIFDIKFGAGKATLQNISASDKASIEGGAGKLNITDSLFNNLDLDMGVGQFEFSGKLSGKNTFKMGVGSSQINLTGSAGDYKLIIKKGLGEILVDQDNVNNNTQLGQGDIELLFEGGVGSAKINFSE